MVVVGNAEIAVGSVIVTESVNEQLLLSVTIYGYVPVDIVTNVIVKHGGLVSGQVPAGVIAVGPIVE